MDSGSELYEELGKADGRLLEQDDDSDDEDSGDHADWTPDPIEADPSKTSRSRKSDDILSTLVNIYGSKELFVNEFRLMLADKLLNNMDFDTDKEIRNLELLKLRFGEASLHNCEIMLKDISDSRRLKSNALSSAKSTSNAGKKMEDVDAIIISRHFWPSLQEESFTPHPQALKVMEEFGKVYAALRKPRKLVWKHNLGMVELELTVAKEKKSFTVSAVHANMILKFGEKDTWSTRDLAAEFETSEEFVTKKMIMWVDKGVIFDRKGENGDILYSVADRLGDVSRASSEMFDTEAGSVSSNDQQQMQEMKVFENYIIGMLKNLDSLPLERIHNMLKMFASNDEHKYDKTSAELSSFLGQLVDQEKVEFLGGQYSLKKK